MLQTYNTPSLVYKPIFAKFRERQFALRLWSSNVTCCLCASS